MANTAEQRLSSGDALGFLIQATETDSVPCDALQMLLQDDQLSAQGAASAPEAGAEAETEAPPPTRTQATAADLGLDERGAGLATVADENTPALTHLDKAIAEEGAGGCPPADAAGEEAAKAEAAQAEEAAKEEAAAKAEAVAKAEAEAAARQQEAEPSQPAAAPAVEEPAAEAGVEAGAAHKTPEGQTDVEANEDAAAKSEALAKADALLTVSNSHDIPVSPGFSATVRSNVPCPRKDPIETLGDVLGGETSNYKNACELTDVPYTESALREVFDSIDTDKADFISEMAMRQYVREVECYGTPDLSPIDAVIKQYGVQDGKLSFDHFCIVMLKLAAR